MYALFYRKHFENGAVGRFSAGFTGDGQGLLGGDLLAPISQRLALVAKLVSHWQEPGLGQRRLLSLLRGHRMIIRRIP